MLEDMNMATRSAVQCIVELLEWSRTEIRSTSRIKKRGTAARPNEQGIVLMIQQTLVIVIYLLTRCSGGTARRTGYSATKSTDSGDRDLPVSAVQWRDGRGANTTNSTVTPGSLWFRGCLW